MPITRSEASKALSEGAKANPRDSKVNPTPIYAVSGESGLAPSGEGSTPLSTTDRLQQLRMKANELGFLSLADATIEELKHQKSSASSVADKYTYTTLLTSIVATEQYVSTDLQFNQTFMKFVTKLAAGQFEREISALAKSDESKFPMAKFSPEWIEKFSPKQLQILHDKYAPSLSWILRNLTLGGPPRPKNPKLRPFDWEMVATIAICMIGYAHNFYCNSLQVREPSSSRCQKYH
jgi:hypothetical protein